MNDRDDRIGNGIARIDSRLVRLVRINDDNGSTSQVIDRKAQHEQEFSQIIERYYIWRRRRREKEKEKG